MAVDDGSQDRVLWRGNVLSLAPDDKPARKANSPAWSCSGRAPPALHLQRVLFLFQPG
jgi:hypothetical protein